MSPSRIARACPVRLAALTLVLAAVVAGVVARRTGTYLGADTAPFFATELRRLPRHALRPLAPLTIAVLGALVLLRSDRIGPRWFGAGAAAVALVARAGLATSRFSGVNEWWWPFTRPNGQETEYPSVFHLVDASPWRFLDRFGELAARLPVHPSGHPPGATLLAWALARLTGDVHGLAVAILVLGAASAWPVLWLARRLVSEREARVATLLWGFAPVTLVDGATSLDAVFVGLAALAALGLVTRRALLGGAATALGVFCSYALALVPLWAVLVAGRRGGARVALVAAGGTLVLLGGLALLAGYDPIAAVQGTREAFDRGIGGRRPYAYWVVGGPAAFLLGLGPLLAERFLAGVERATPGARALAAALVLAALSGVIKAEVERILQFAVPFAAIAAAPLTGRRWAAVVVTAGAVQALVVELRWDTTF